MVKVENETGPGDAEEMLKFNEMTATICTICAIKVLGKRVRSKERKDPEDNRHYAL